MVQNKDPKKKPKPQTDEPITIEYKDMLLSDKIKTTLIDPKLESIVLYSGVKEEIPIF